MLIGYVRVSTNDQNTDLQRNVLNCAGCELIFEDKISGTKSERPGLKKLLRTLSAGDTLVVWKLDRLGRSMRHLVVLVEELRERGINFRSLTDSIDTSTPMGRFFFHVMPPCGITCCLLEGKHQHLQHNFVKLLDKEQLFLYTRNSCSGTPVPIIQ